MEFFINFAGCMVENMQFTAVMLMALMTVALAFWMPRRVNYNRVANRSRWLMASGLALLGLQFALQYHYGFRAQGVTQAVFVNLLFFIPCAVLISLSVLNLQRQGRILLREYLVGPAAWAVAVITMVTVGQMNGCQLMIDTPEMRNAEMMASVCYAAMQLYYAYLQLIELRRMQTALHNYYDRERSSLLNWMRWSVAVLSVLALMAPILIYMQGLILTVYALMLFVGIFYMWLQFIGYIRTNAAERMREAEETMDEDGCNEEAELDDAPVIAAAAERWLADGKHLHNGITIKTAAEEMGVARCRLTAWLKQTDYEQFTAWITYHRIEAAKRLLKQHSDWSNEAVAQACGFSTRNYFQTVFKKEVGMTPSEYQQKD